MECEPALDELVASFEAGELTGDEFPHARHVRVAWALARTYGRSEGLKRLVDGIRGIAARAGRPDAYHVTITRAWFELIASVDDLAEHEELFDRRLLDRYYSRARLAAGRDEWLEPDLRPLALPPADDPTIDFRSVVRRIPTSVAVLTARVGDVVHGTTVSSIASVSRDPALVSVSVANGSRTLGLLRHAKTFALSVLASGQVDIAARFADGDRPAGTAQFRGVPHEMTPFGPVLAEAALRIGCELHAQHRCGDQHLLIGAIRSAEATPGAHPLLQHGGAFH